MHNAFCKKLEKNSLYSSSENKYVNDVPLHYLDGLENTFNISKFILTHFC